MTILNVILYIVVPSIMAACIVYWYGWRSMKKKIIPVIPKEAHKLEEKTVISELPVEARIFDNKKRKVYNDLLPGDVVAEVKETYSDLGRQWNKDGLLLYELCLKASGEYVPLETYLTIARDNPPTRVHRALNQKEKMSIAFNTKTSKSLMEKYGKYLPWLLAIAFVIFLIVASGKE